MPSPQPLKIIGGPQRRESNYLLSPVAYDDDATSLHSNRSDQETDSEDDEVLAHARNSQELRARDRLVLMEEEEMDRLVADTRAKKEERERLRRGSNLAIPNPLSILRRSRSNSPLDTAAGGSTDNLVVGDDGGERRKKRRSRRKEKKDRLLQDARHGEDAELMYEMESGDMKEGSSTGDSSDREGSDELDRRHLSMHSKTDKKRRWKRWLFLYTLIAVGFAFVVLLAWKISLDKKRETQKYVSNGTALFAPTTIIISLDGFRADFLQRGLTPRLNSFVKEGVSPLYMLPSFPSVTFPVTNWRRITILLLRVFTPESHGVVGNTFWDPDLQAEFYYTDPSRSMQSKWWDGEPFWVTAETQGIRTAVHMWPGSEAHIMDMEPSFLDPYKGKEKLPKKVDRLLELLDMPGMENPGVDISDMRPQLIAAYVPNVDADGHRYGPNSTEIRSTIKDVDTMLDQLFHGLEQRNLTNIVNVIIVSDHGMATTDVSRMIQIDDVVDLDKVAHVDGWPLVGIRPKDPADLQVLYEQALGNLKDNPSYEVRLKDKDMPERYHFSKNDRIAPLWIIPKAGWAIVKKEEFDIQDAKTKGLEYDPHGLHGYDHEHPLMRAIFIARGPAFPHQPNSKIEAFQNIEVYNMLCDSVGMEPKPNNGTIRLPLKPIGLHDSEPGIEELADPETTASSPAAAASAATSVSATSSVGNAVTTTTTAQNPTSTQPIGVDPVKASSSKGSGVEPVVGSPSKPLGVDPVETGPPERPHPNEDKEETQHFKSTTELWDWLKDKAGHVWGKVTGGSGSS
ncbi:type I phosphodiesterase/nucleotide pyrophosphatase [Apiospora phragmitis]|uniref:Type I phosphodiesterase/nucleotide pyrophosphatase n=1 Tax=Apiospora phragmitis TaxID=2905665 RepID=A0ABR1UUA2_9PEZI